VKIKKDIDQGLERNHGLKLDLNQTYLTTEKTRGSLFQLARYGRFKPDGKRV